jgi:uncharacterized DUF497 family protein
MTELKVTGFIWLDEIVEKLAGKHQVDPREVEELFGDDPKFRFVESGNRRGEDVYGAFGQTSGGRYLVIFFISKADGRALPVSARDMTTREQKRYVRK